ncbi:MAG: hypothetical protein K8W52_44095 [Deltaproteobacteria bacterium]|nr:hypothetical protein [Deltaproteobacteria bacterium]
MGRAAVLWFDVAIALTCACRAREEAPANPSPPPVKAPVADAPASPAPTADGAKGDPATAAPIDLRSIKAFADVVMTAPPGARVIPDEPQGVTISSGEFSLHLRYRGGVNGEADRIPPRLEPRRTYVELTRAPDRLEYRIDDHGWNADGALRTTASAYGFVVAIPGLGAPGAKLLCGPAKLPSSADGLAPYRAACASVTTRAARVEPLPAPAKRPPGPAASGTIDPATFAPVDLGGIRRFADVAVTAPAGAVVVADAPRGATISSAGFVLHLQCERLGDLVSARKDRATREGATYAEVASPQFEQGYTIDTGGTTTYGFWKTIDREQLSFTRSCDFDGLLCGPLNEQPTTDDLAPYRAACASVTK